MCYFFSFAYLLSQGNLLGLCWGLRQRLGINVFTACRRRKVYALMITTHIHRMIENNTIEMKLQRCPSPHIPIGGVDLLQEFG
ncbi:hypothetical protein XELAEV_18002871mg [Xenopus laevis]|uniref:Secreted protein n=1 Tax=Xenopus laevis TaxID=8355 RepID=A0A974BPR5_XENLA|nr:hypothetical protein XELAEV_18002871mg [Xenopus laevis]